MNTLQQKIESVLFYKNEPMSYVWLAKTFGLSLGEIKDAVAGMHDFYQSRGISLAISETSVSLMTSLVGSETITLMTKKEDAKDLSKQALETLSIIIYKGLVTKAEIDYIRGVNSVFILRNLLIRGLIEKSHNPSDKRAPLYTITHDTLSFIGITKATELPEYELYSKKLLELEQAYIQETTEEQKPSDI